MHGNGGFRAVCDGNSDNRPRMALALKFARQTKTYLLPATSAETATGSGLGTGIIQILPSGAALIRNDWRKRNRLFFYAAERVNDLRPFWSASGPDFRGISKHLKTCMVQMRMPVFNVWKRLPFSNSSKLAVVGTIEVSGKDLIWRISQYERWTSAYVSLIYLNLLSGYFVAKSSKAFFQFSSFSSSSVTTISVDLPSLVAYKR